MLSPSYLEAEQHRRFRCEMTFLLGRACSWATCGTCGPTRLRGVAWGVGGVRCGGVPLCAVEVAEAEQR